jgi:phage gpG-like protein
MARLQDLEKRIRRAAAQLPDQTLKIIEVEGMGFINTNFRDQGFNDGSLRKWKPRKTTDKRGRDITRYRTNRVGKAGNLNRYGSKNQGRGLLIGHGTGGNKLRSSFSATRTKVKVRFRTNKDYAEVHNEGLGDMPQRQFIGKSRTLENNIKKKLTKELDKLFK